MDGVRSTSLHGAVIIIISNVHSQLLDGQHFSGFWNIILIQYGVMAVALGSKDFINHGFIDLSLEARLFGGPGDWLRFAVLEVLQISGALLIYPAFTVRVFQALT